MTFALPNLGKGWNHDLCRTLILALLRVRMCCNNTGLSGPFQIIYGPPWDQVMDGGYALVGGNIGTTMVRERILNIEGIESVVRADWGFDDSRILFCQFTREKSVVIIGEVGAA